MKYWKTLSLFLFVFALSQPALSEKGNKSKVTKKSEKIKQENHKEHEIHKKQKGHKKHDHSSQKATLERTGKAKLVVKVKGMVCAFCAQGIRENFNKRKEVKSAKVNLDKMEVAVELHEGTILSEEAIEKIVTDAGFSYEGTKK